MNALLEEKLVQHPFLQNLAPELLDMMMERSTPTDFSPGELILKEGEPANRFFLIDSGKVILQAGTTGETIQILGAGEVLGWSWLFPPFCWNFSARALEPTHCTVLNGGYLLVRAEENHEFGYQLMRRVAQIVIERLQATRQKLLATANR